MSGFGEDTLERIDDHDDFEIATYAPVKAWILQRDVKLKLRKNTPTKTSVKRPNDMVYGVKDAPPPAEQAAPLQHILDMPLRPPRARRPPHQGWPARDKQQPCGRLSAPSGLLRVEIWISLARARPKARSSKGLDLL